MSPRKDDPQAMAEMKRWLHDVCTTIGVDESVIDQNTDALLHTIGLVAHGPSRPGAPLTAFLIGYAAAASGQAPEELCATINSRIESWVPHD